MSNSWDCENYGDDCGGHSCSDTSYTPDPEWNRRNWESTEYFFTGMGLGSFCGFVMPAVFLAVYSEKVASFLNNYNLKDYNGEIISCALVVSTGVGALIGCYIGSGLFEWKEKRMERLKHDSIEEKIEDGAERNQITNLTLGHLVENHIKEHPGNYPSWERYFAGK